MTSSGARMRWSAVWACGVLLGCGGVRKLPAKPTVVALGECSNPLRDGVVSDEPVLRDASRDLNGDGVLERVVADERVCRNGNCQWNMFHSEGPRCWRYIGTVAGRFLTVEDTTEGDFGEVRALWSFPGKRRYLLQNYRFHVGGYRLEEAMVCVPKDDDRVECAPEHTRASPAGP